MRQRNVKKCEPTIYQPKRRTTAVRSPSSQPGQGPHYLKKSPSPTSTKPLPGSLSPTTETYNNNHGTATLSTPPSVKTQAITITPSNYSEENEIQRKAVVNICERNGNGNGNVGQSLETSVTSIDSNDAQDYGKLGSIVFKLRYLIDRNALVVSVIRCRGLPYKTLNDELPNGMNGKSQTASDPYVKLQLLPDKQHKVKTRLVLLCFFSRNLYDFRWVFSLSVNSVVRNTRNPVYDEDFTFYGLNLSELSTMSLHFVVLSFDRYSRDDIIGEVILPMNGIDLNQIETQQVAFSKEIQPRSLKVSSSNKFD